MWALGSADSLAGNALPPISSASSLSSVSTLYYRFRSDGSIYWVLFSKVTQDWCFNGTVFGVCWRLDPTDVVTCGTLPQHGHLCHYWFTRMTYSASYTAFSPVPIKDETIDTADWVIVPIASWRKTNLIPHKHPVLTLLNSLESKQSGIIYFK